jgi:two-component system, OmpR family, copper resistance phosphate regulon response regulator CusR
MHILIAEDDAPVARFLAGEFEAEHYDVSIADTGSQVRRMLEDTECDLIILELDLPDMSGMDVLRQVRIQRPNLPVLILTESARLEDRVNGLDSGADDYLTKPFAFSELSARVRALLRRSGLPLGHVLRTMDLELDRVRRTVSRNGRSIELTPKEFALLECLMLNAGRNVSRAAIILHVWKRSSETLTNVVDVYINYLRKKIDEGCPEKLIHTARGAGYRIGESLAHREEEPRSANRPVSPEPLATLASSSEKSSY